MNAYTYRALSSARIACLLVTSWFITLPTLRAAESLLQHGNARVVLVGDSITGFSRNYPAGYAKQMDWALQQVYPDCKPNIVALGGSGQGVGTWLNIEKRSRTEEVTLDIKGIEVKAALEHHADVLVIMLGMNDVLSPRIAGDDASLDQWVAWYRELITNLRARLSPKVIALGTATLCTEDIASPKNRMIDKLNERAVKLAKELDLRILPTNETMRDVLQMGRHRAPDFHVTYDFVHPNEAGHIAVAMAMLKGLGEVEAAAKLEQTRLPQAINKAAGPLPSLSYEIAPLPADENDARQSFHVRCWLTLPAGASGKPKLRLSGEGWEVKPAMLETGEGEFTITGKPERRENVLTLQGEAGAKTLTQEIRIPAPWLVTAGIQRRFWNGKVFDVTKAHGPIDEAIEQGRDFTQTPGTKWQRYFPSVNFSGGSFPGSVDFAAITHAKPMEAGYAARWVYSDRDRPVNVTLGVQTFASTLHTVVHLNTNTIYNGLLTAEPGKSKVVEARLHKGWNALVVNANHTEWQWQCSVDLTGLGDDKLADLRYAVKPPSPR
jgi:lysophospholipase L1-like esterase